MEHLINKLTFSDICFFLAVVAGLWLIYINHQNDLAEKDELLWLEQQERLQMLEYDPELIAQLQDYMD